MKINGLNPITAYKMPRDVFVSDRRSSYEAAFDGNVTDDGGTFGGGQIDDVSIITVGEALGWREFADETFVAEIGDAVKAAGAEGVPSNLGHFENRSPIGDDIGRITFKRIGKTQAFGRLDIYEVSEGSEMQGPRIHLLDKARQAPADLGLSIVYMHDSKRELEFLLEHGAEADEFGYVDFSTFNSPHKGNNQNYLHARLKELISIDVVRTPAANADGLFEANDEWSEYAKKEETGGTPEPKHDTEAALAKALDIIAKL